MATNPTTGLDDRYNDDGGSVINTRVDQMVNWLLNWGRANSVWYLLFGLACCAIELMQTGGPRADLERFGSAPRPSPRSSDLIIVAGTLTYKMALRVKRLFDQMSEPRYVISMGACASSGGIFDTYTMVQGIDTIIPVDVYVPGCPPRPEGLLYGIMLLQKKIKGENVFDPSLRTEIQAGPDGLLLPAARIDEVSEPFGNSVHQTRSA